MTKKQEQFDKTHVKIKQCFRNLLLNNDLSEITVTMVATSCNINRKTYYLHYHSIEELTDDMISDIFTELLQTVAPLISKGTITPYNFALKLNEIIDKDYDFHMKMLSSTGSNSIVARIQQMWIKNIEMIKMILPNVDEKKAQVLLYGFANGLISMYSYVYINKVDMTLDDIAKLTYSSLLSNGLFHEPTVPVTTGR